MWKTGLESGHLVPQRPSPHTHKTPFLPQSKRQKHMHYATTYGRPLFSKTAGLVLVVTPISTFNIAIIFLIDKRTQDMRMWRIL